ncbi:MAG: TonB system transport protein ExbD [Rhodobacterales bacterium]|nr:TonB system transport protein ExbD [Rhodobacterales bacterium]
MALRLDDGDTELSEINVTPFIDVMLVLLIVFMIAAPLSTVDVPVNLPASSAPPGDRPDDPLWLTLSVDGRLLLDDRTIERNALAAALDGQTAGKRDTPVYLRADSSVDYAALMKLLDLLRGAGYLKVALVGLETAP